MAAADLYKRAIRGPDRLPGASGLQPGLACRSGGEPSTRTSRACPASAGKWEEIEFLLGVISNPSWRLPLLGLFGVT